MKVSLNWLKQYVDIDNFTPQEIAEKLTRSGVEVDAVTKLNENISGIVVGKVVECVKHPEADKLNICQVDIGVENSPVQIVCGAKNVGRDQYVAVAKVGAKLPSGLKIKKAKLRGQVSEGMICSLQELGFEGKVVPKKYSEGIYVFPEEMTVGEDALEPLNLNDTILELDLTPNRADCLSMIGVAYEIAAILNLEVNLPEPVIVTSNEKASEVISIHVESDRDNPMYDATVIQNVNIGESPLWLQSTLMAAGIRPLNNIVDITNYVLFEYGQPLHAFDLNKIDTKKIVVRRGQNETFKTLDNSDRTVTEDHLVITDGNKPLALAGVMGGLDSEVTDNTTAILLESAFFSSSAVRKSSRDHNLRSDASSRFEKGIDPNRVLEAGVRTASLIQQLAGGEILDKENMTCDKLDRSEKEISITLDRINRTLGTELSNSEVNQIFSRLKFDVKSDKKNDFPEYKITVPTRRQDITIQADIIEEVARLYGYDNIPTTLPNTPSTPGGLSDKQKKKRKVRRYLESAGMNEAISYSLTTPDAESYFTHHKEHVSILMPMSEERRTLRTTLLPQLLDAMLYNKNRRIPDVKLFEAGTVYFKQDEELLKQPEEKFYLSGAAMGIWQEHSWQGEKKKIDFYVLKGILEGLFEELHLLERIEFIQASDYPGFHPGRTAEIRLDNEALGVIGELHPEVLKQWDLPESYAFELNLDTLTSDQSGKVNYERIPRYPSIDRDIALVVDEDKQAGAILNTILAAGKPLLKHAELFDVYTGKGVEEKKKSLAFSLRYQDPEQTLTDEEVNEVHHSLLTTLEVEHQATLRTI